MSQTGLRAFDSSLQKTHIWLNELTEMMGWEPNAQKAYSALRAVLHAIRDDLPAQEAVHLADELPLLIRGMYYEGWNPSPKQLRKHHKTNFLSLVRENLRGRPNDERFGDFEERLDQIVKNVFDLLKKKISSGEMTDVQGNFPPELQSYLQ